MNFLRSELLHTTRTGTMAELTGALAHELNHPLGSILNNANAAKRFLRNESPDLDEIREIIDDIISEDKRARDVMQKLRALMKKSEVVFNQININNIIEEVIILTHSELIIENITLSKQLGKRLPPILGDRIQLQQVFLNLIINAKDAMKECIEKKLHISTTVDDPDNILVCVRDSGTGIEADKAEKLFKPFFTTKQEGMGMGLSVNKTIIESHDGKIWSENNEDRKGASFFIKFPIYKEKSS
jgi:two-component system sensor kinase FixL